MRPRDTLTPEQRRDLEAIDRALAGEPVEYELRELEELVGDIRATGPEMSPAFAARLEHEVSEGFPTPREQPSPVRRPGRRWLLLPAGGALAAVLAALVVVLAGNDGSDEINSFSGETADLPAAAVERDSRGAAAQGESTDEAASEPAPASPQASSGARVAPAPVPPAAETQGPRKVERSASMALETPAEDFERTTDAVNAVVARFGGIVASSQIGESEVAGGEASFDLRIPTDRLDRALAALAKLGHVTERSQGLQDITGSLRSAQERLTDARAERRGLLRALERATTQAQIDSLKAQLRSVGAQIGNLKGRLSALRRRADLATVSLTVRGTGESGATGGGQWTPGDAAADALRVLEVAAGILLVALAVLVPLGLVAAAVGFGVRLGRRRRREAALDPA